MRTLEFEDFDIKTVTLEGTNLVEAGAGTGKTYSIAILALRLLLEKEYAIKDLLMVTFTKPATAELESRIRQFVRIAYNYCNDAPTQDQVIIDIVNKFNDKEKAKRLLGKALLELDETSIYTIHSFCHKTLTEFAFETGQIFGSEGLEDLTELINDEVNAFWRNEVSTLDSELLKELRTCTYKVYTDRPKYLTRDSITTVINKAMAGMAFNGETRKITSFDEYKAAREAIDEGITVLINNNKQDYINRINNHTGERYTAKAKLNLVDRLSEPLGFVTHIIKTTAQHDNAIFSAEKKIFLEAKAEKDALPIRIINDLFKKAVDTITPRITAELRTRNQVSFDEMIKLLHQALANPKLKTLLQERYPAVFIDEFQDTDNFQYAIFNTLFGSASILFFIGDPKQAIYAWRKADITTYFAAREGVNKRYKMKTNFRSNEKLVEAFNKFFQKTSDFDPFCNDSTSAEKMIEYTDVTANSNKPQKELSMDNKSMEPITIFTDLQTESQINAAVCDTVSALLANGKLAGETIKPSNIAILTRTNREAQGLSDILKSNKIPAIVISDEKIFSSPEAKYLMFFLEAVNTISIKTIARALLSPFTGFGSSKIKDLDPDVNVNLFRGYLDTLKKDGIYTCVSRFVADYKIKEHLLSESVKGGHRILSNLLQLSEELQNAQKKRGLDETELLSFLKKAIDGIETAGDNYLQRIESDNDALTIITVHKSKGLEYDIVLIPFMDLAVNTRGAFTSYRNDQNGAYEFTTNKGIDPKAVAYFETQTEQENSRLIYVAITRAKYQCFIYKNDKETALSPYINSLASKTDYKELIVVKKYTNYNAVYTPDIVTFNYNYPEVPNFELKDKNWSKMSYSALSGAHKSSPKISSKVYKTEYDEFIFSELERGTNAGEFLHSIFEWIDFTDHDSWAGVLEKSLKRYLPTKRKFKEPLREFLKVILTTEITGLEDSIFLDRISNAQKCNELEFDINLNEFQVSQLATLSTDRIEIHTSNAGKLYGVLNGLMDLFFHYNGKYYILDWKSNYLGDDLNDYAPDKLNEAMNENNYHLQYLIYTYAAKKYLEFKITNFDYSKQFGGVIYLFLRGVRPGSNTGVFVTKPTEHQISALDTIFSGVNT